MELNGSTYCIFICRLWIMHVEYEYKYFTHHFFQKHHLLIIEDFIYPFPLNVLCLLLPVKRSLEKADRCNSIS